jgi:hypothetical protein
LGGENSRRISPRKGGRLHSRLALSVRINRRHGKKITVTFVWQNGDR